jgi:plastocyanin
VRKRLAILLMATLVLSACEGDEAGVDEEAQQDETPAECADVSAPEGASAPLTMSDNFFDPLCLAVSSTQEITMTNTGVALHNFSIEDQGVDIDVEAGAEETTGPVEELVRPGTFRFICKYHEAEGMVGTLVVE